MRRIISVIIMAFISCCLTTAHGQEVETFVTNLLEEYPKARLLDIYKSCFQDYMGAEHLVGDTASVRYYLEQELATTSIEDMCPWYYEPCGINGNYVRVSLRAVLDGIVPANTLLEAFVSSANQAEHPSIESWVLRWQEIVSAIDKMNINLPHYDQDKQYIEDVLAQNRYAISHSGEYRNAYSPHYRIVKRDIFERLIVPLLP